MYWLSVLVRSDHRCRGPQRGNSRAPSTSGAPRDAHGCVHGGCTDPGVPDEPHVAAARRPRNRTHGGPHPGNWWSTYLQQEMVHYATSDLVGCQARVVDLKVLPPRNGCCEI